MHNLEYVTLLCLPASAAAAICIGGLRIMSPLPLWYVFNALYLCNKYQHVNCSYV